MAITRAFVAPFFFEMGAFGQFENACLMRALSLPNGMRI